MDETWRNRLLDNPLYHLAKLDIMNEGLPKLLRGCCPFGSSSGDNCKARYRIENLATIVKILSLLIEERVIHSKDIELELINMLQDYKYSLVVLTYVHFYLKNYMTDKRYNPFPWRLDYHNLLQLFVNKRWSYSSSEENLKYTYNFLVSSINTIDPDTSKIISNRGLDYYFDKT